jgi:hypothetical protein
MEAVIINLKQKKLQAGASTPENVFLLLREH